MGIRTKKVESKTKSIYQEYTSLNDFYARRKAWVDYYAKVPTTRAYKRFKEGHEALKTGQMATIKLLAEEAREDLINDVRELTQPPYPDPELERRYKRLEVYEWDTETNIVKAAEEIFAE